MINRDLMQFIEPRLFKGKLIVILGARQVGKTTLARELQKKIDYKSLWLNADEPDVKKQLSNVTSTQLRSLIGNNELVFIDEAQRIENIGITLKLIVDNIPNVQVIVTGSSSFELSGKINEPLTGRKFEYFLYPLSSNELIQHTDLTKEKRLLEQRMIFGFYPEVVTKPGEEKTILREISNSYLYKDVLATGKIKKPNALQKLLQALALQIGKEVSYNELGQLIGVDNQTVDRWIDILEKSFVLFRLSPLSRNLRNELKKANKIYFYDNGIRNSIIKNFNPLSLRQDVGELWENFLLSERLKYLQRNEIFANLYFWKSRNQQEIDFIEEYDGKLHAYEFKWNPGRSVKFPKTFLKLYPQAETNVVNRANYQDFAF